MDPLIAKMCARYCQNSLVITRDEESRTLLRELGVPTELGTDTAWTSEPARRVRSGSIGKIGWVGRTPGAGGVSHQPFRMAGQGLGRQVPARALTGAYKESHYRSVYFHNSGPAADRALELSDRHRQRSRRLPQAAQGLRSACRYRTPGCSTGEAHLGKTRRRAVLSSEDYEIQLVSILRACHMMVSSRYHGIVTSMPALVSSAGITMDERIRNLMRERGHQDLLMNVDDPDLEPKLTAALEKLATQGEAISVGIGQTVVKNLKVMARMGVYFREKCNGAIPSSPPARENGVGKTTCRRSAKG